MDSAAQTPAGRPVGRDQTLLKVVLAISFSHMLNDTIQSLLPAIYPLLKSAFQLSFTQVGLITLTFQCTGSLLQPLVGIYTDRRPKPYSLAIGMGFTLVGVVFLSLANRYSLVLAAAALIGIGSSIFHPEASRMAKVAADGRHGFAQSVFQVGGNLGTSFGPLLAAAIVVPKGQRSIFGFSLVALLGIVVLSKVGGWYTRRLAEMRSSPRKPDQVWHPRLSRGRVIASIGVLMALVFSKFIYMTSMTNYFTFYLIHKFNVGVQSAQICLFAFLFFVAVGTILGGPLGDRFGRKYVIWISVLGVAPFTLILPHVNLMWTIILTLPIGIILASAFSVIVVYAQELIPGRPGTVAGLLYGLAFGIAGLGSAVLGNLADRTSIYFVYNVCAFLPLIGLIAVFLPDLKKLANSDERKQPAS